MATLDVEIRPFPGGAGAYVVAYGIVHKVEAPVAEIIRRMRDEANEPADPPVPEITWRCRSCGDDFDEDDLEQAQPDGHYVCPDCPDDLSIVAIPTGAISRLRSLIFDETIGRHTSDTPNPGAAP